MHNLIISIIATISFFSLGLYEFISICRIFNKKELVEKIWKKLLPNKKYSEILVFELIRSLLLLISCITYAFAAPVLLINPIFMILLRLAPVFAFINLIITAKKR